VSVGTAIISDKRVVLTRTLRHPPARVFAAWTRVDQIEEWLTPGPGTTIEADVDCREGGKLSFVFHDPDGTKNRVTGRYLIVRPPERLVFTWQWQASEAPGGAAPRHVPADAVGVETLVTVDFAPRPDGTLLTVTHQHFKTDSEAERHSAGWTGALDRLPDYLDAQRPAQQGE
jgi:uncharacterized protein YndB with AHSA1/START domain